MAVVIADVAADGIFEFGDGSEDAATDAPSCDDGKEALDGVEPEPVPAKAGNADVGVK